VSPEGVPLPSHVIDAVLENGGSALVVREQW
jgi:hypothetical protein